MSTTPPIRQRAKPHLPILAILATLAAAACSSSPSPAPNPGTTAADRTNAPQPDDARRALNARARREQGSSSPDATAAAQPHFDALRERLNIDPANPDRLLTLADALALAARGHQSDNPDTPTPQINDDQRQRAAALREEARALAASGDLNNAVTRFRQAASADPTHAPTWRELGLAAATLQNRPLARAALAEAFRLGDRDPRALERLATLAAEGAQHTLVLAAIDARTADNDAPLQPTTLAALADALDAEGYALAAAQAKHQLADRLLDINGQSAKPIESARDRRLAPRVLVDAAERFAAIERYNEARDALTRAAEALAAPQSDNTDPPPRIQRRLAWIALAEGRPAQAALHALDAVEASPIPTPDDAAIARALAPLDDERRVLRSAFDALAERAHDATFEWALLRAAVADSPQRAARILTTPFADAPHDPDLLIATLDTLPPLTQQAQRQAVIALVETAPHRTDTILRAALETLDTQALTPPQPDADDPLESTVALRLQRLQQREPLDRGTTAELVARFPDAPAPALLHAATLVDHARGRDADEIVDGLVQPERAPEPSLTLTAATHFLDRGDTRRAQTLARRVIDAPSATNPQRDTARLLIARAQAANGRPGAALQTVEAVLEDTPRHAAALTLRLALAQASGEPAERIAQHAADISQHLPGSRADRWLDAQRAIATDRPSRAVPMLLALAQEPVPSDAVLEALLAATVAADQTERLTAFADRAAEDRPHDPRFTALRIRARTTAGAPRAALRIANAFLNRWPADTTVLLAAQRAAERSGDTPEAPRYALARLRSAPETLATLLETALIHASNRNPTAARNTLRRAASLADAQRLEPTPTETTIAQGAALAIAANLPQPFNDNPLVADAGAALDAIDQLTGDLPLSAVFAKLAIAAETDNPPNADRLIALAVRATDADPTAFDNACHDAALRLNARTINAIRAGAEPNPGVIPELDTLFTFLQHVTAENAPLPTATLALRLYAALVYDRNADLIDTLNLAIENETIPDTLATTADRYFQHLQPDPETGRSVPVQLALASAARMPDEHFDTAALLYAYAITRNPNDPQVLNSYGYRLLERNERIDDAARMIARAHQQMPDSAAITDSLGWARYKQGIFADTPDTRGAVSLLTDALQLALNPAEGEPDSATAAVVADHLADAHWRAGQREQALDRWQQAAQLAAQATQDPDLPAGPATDEIRAVAVNAPAKIRDAESGRAPTLAPVPALGEPVPTTNNQ